MQFRGEYDFLSNFYTAPITYNGLTYQNNECAFQAQKTLDESKREEFTHCSPKDAKHLGKRVELRSDWEEVKFDIMKDIVKAKFEQHPELVQRLLATGDTPIVEENTWGDRIWGVCNGYGENRLGRILSDVRNEYKENVINGLTKDIPTTSKTR